MEAPKAKVPQMSKLYTEVMQGKESMA